MSKVDDAERKSLGAEEVDAGVESTGKTVKKAGASSVGKTERKAAKAKGFWRQQWWLIIVIVLGLVALIDQTMVWDIWQGLSYNPDETVQEIEQDLELTGTGKRVFKATRPVVEGAEEFNKHCGEHTSDVSVLGCYVEGRIYVYEITDEQLALANKVTAAHELLHARWERMSEKEREEVKSWLAEVKEQNAEWLEDELETYGEDEQIEEIYTRAGTKLADLPEGLEKHYAEYFKNRARIVEMYQIYEAPFKKLQAEIERLYTEIEDARVKIEQEKAEYEQDVDALDARIDQFNGCAETVNCFTQAEFDRQRAGLIAQRDQLEERRTALNQKIDENNARIDDYLKQQEALGGLYNLMDSNIERIEDENEI